MLRGEDQKLELIEKTTLMVRERVDRKESPTVISFINAFFDLVPPDEVLDHTQDTLYGIGLSMYNLAKKKADKPMVVDVYNPRVDEHGWASKHTSLMLINDDMPFIVDSVVNLISSRDLNIHALLHPVVSLQRDSKGKLSKILGAKSTASTASKTASFESFMYIEVDQQTSEADLQDLKQALESVLHDVHLAVNDWPTMLDRMKQAAKDVAKDPSPARKEDKDEVVAFLEWLANNHFTLLGARDYAITMPSKSTGTGTITMVEDTGLGLKRDPSLSALGEGENTDMTDATTQFFAEPTLLNITKANRRSTVHRSAPLDYVGVKKFDKKGNIIGERRFVGLFTSAAYSRSPRDVPYLRQKVDDVVRRAKLDPKGHGGKALIHILENFPRDELFQSTVEHLYQTVMGIMSLNERPRLRLFVRQDVLERFVSVMVFVPRERYTSDLRMRLADTLCDAYAGELENYSAKLSEDDTLARVLFTIRTQPGQRKEPDLDWLEAKLKDQARSWGDDLERAMLDHWGEANGQKIRAKYGDAFPSGYKERFGIQSAIFDIEQLESLTDEANNVVINLSRMMEDPTNSARLKLYQSGAPIALSECIPMMERMGLKVIEEHPYVIKAYADTDKEVTLWVRDFFLLDPDGEDINIHAIKSLFEETFLEVFKGRAESDTFNHLVLKAQMTSREVVAVRAYAKFLRQVGIAFSLDYMADTLNNNTAVTRLLVDLFHARFNPAAAQDMAARDKATQKIEQDLLEALDAVMNLDEDRILRRFLNLIKSTLRTNFYQPAEDGTPKSYVSFKIDSRALEDAPLPRPLVEIWVYSPRVEGTHLRFGRVARGGLRWSDRREDFRTEILGLVKAQQVKNTIIVPVGSKGGFYAKKLPSPSNRDAFMAEGIESYKTFLRGLLDLTDNVKANAIVPPKSVVRHDEDDPYLVVAADKGTATFSDFANEVSREYGHWLDDAFASGGSQGYDHKKMGITAKGAWESVKRHFREMGLNTQTDPFTVVGIGDMSGDVFGNGMLLSEQIKLVAAFNHLHIFIDPNPDPAKSYKERERMFALPRSTWADYDTKLISKGGGIFDRKAKSIKLTPEIQKMIGTKVSIMTPTELMNALLKAEADLLWFGGIGTYVKGDHETNADVGDRANDALRVSGSELRCKVVGEGGNLGMTQLGRIAYANTGGRCNTDAVDNSAGVDCSDHEVNIKILLGAIMDEGELTEKQRNRLLADMTDEVSDLVLRDNYLQTQSLSVTHSIANELIEPYARMMQDLEKQGRLDRAIEFLPDDEDLQQRMKDGVGLSRPELCVMLAYAKLGLYDDLLASNLVDDPYFADDLLMYFPTPLRKKYAKPIAKHQLRREIIATQVSNSLVNRLGSSFLNQMMEITGASAAEVAWAYIVARDAFKVREIWGAIEALDNKVPAETQITMLDMSKKLLRHGTLWFIRNRQPDATVAGTVDMYGAGIIEIAGKLGNALSGADKEKVEATAVGFIKDGVPKDLAQRIALMPYMASGPDIVRVAESTGRSVTDAGKVYFSIGRRLSLDWYRQTADSIRVKNHWQRLAVRAIIDNLFTDQRLLTQVFLDSATKSTKAEKVVDDWCAGHDPALRIVDEMLAEFQATPNLDLAMLSIAENRIQALTYLP